MNTPRIASDQVLPLTLSTTQAATLCGVSPTTIRKWIALGLLPVVNVPGDYRVSTDVLRDFLRGVEIARVEIPGQLALPVDGGDAA